MQEKKRGSQTLRAIQSLSLSQNSGSTTLLRRHVKPIDPPQKSTLQRNYTSQTQSHVSDANATGTRTGMFELMILDRQIVASQALCKMPTHSLSTQRKRKMNMQLTFVVELITFVMKSMSPLIARQNKIINSHEQTLKHVKHHLSNH